MMIPLINIRSMLSLTTLVVFSLLFVSTSFAQKDDGNDDGGVTRMVTNTYNPDSGLPAAIPDNIPAGVNLPFTVSGLTGNLYHVRVANWTWSPVHTWSGDITMTLSAPGGTPTATITQRRGRTTCTTGAGSSDDLAGPYSFGDGFVTNFHPDTVPNPVPAGNYRASRCVTTAGELVALDSTFAGPVIAPPIDFNKQDKGIESFRNLAPEAANGVWTLNINDQGAADTGTVTAVQLVLQTAAPVAANGAVSGKVVDEKGRGIGRAKVTLTDTNSGVTKEFTTNSFGSFTFDELEVGHFFIISVSHKRYQFQNSTQSFTLSEDLGGIDFVGSSLF